MSIERPLRTNRRLRVLDCFSGSGSLAKWCAKYPERIEVTSLDIRSVGEFTPTILCDFNTFDYVSSFPVGYFDYIHASPPCTHYSQARTKAKTPRDFAGADALVQRTINMIAYLQPRAWTIENPATGLLPRRTVVGGLPWVRVSWCQYGAKHRKDTAIWTNVTQFVPKVCPEQGCIAMIPGTSRHMHTMSSQRKYMHAEQRNIKDPYEKGYIPEKFILEFMNCIARAEGIAPFRPRGLSHVE